MPVRSRNRIKYPLKEMPDGHWYVCTTDRQTYYPSTKSATRKEAKGRALFMEGHDLLEKLADVQKKLEAGGYVDERDPYGWRA